MSNKTYDILKLVALLFVPVSTFAGALLSIWNVPHCDQITATLAAADTCIGAIVVIFSKIYNKPYPMDVEGLDYIEDGEDDEQN